jgi:nucleoside 2-deoxyribosyltransferase
MHTILVAGSKNLGCDASEKRVLSEALGAAIASEPGWRLLTGGARGEGACDNAGGVDYHAALGAKRLLDDPFLERERILTLHPRDGREDLFAIGSVLRSKARSTFARRFELVARADCAFLIEGGEGTQQIIEYAIAAGKAVVPIPCTGGAAEAAWRAEQYRGDLLHTLGLQEASAELGILQFGLKAPAAIVDTCLLIARRVLQASCFVIMPFQQAHSDRLWSEVLVPVIKDVGLTPSRADLVHNVGPVMEDVTHSIREASVVVADITDTNPNVMYELGYAHALGKATILLCCTADKQDWADTLPFDVRGMRVIPVSAWRLDDFRKEFRAVLQQLRGTS